MPNTKKTCGTCGHLRTKKKDKYNMKKTHLPHPPAANCVTCVNLQHLLPPASFPPASAALGRPPPKAEKEKNKEDNDIKKTPASPVFNFKFEKRKRRRVLTTSSLADDGYETPTKTTSPKGKERFPDVSQDPKKADEAGHDDDEDETPEEKAPVSRMRWIVSPKKNKSPPRPSTSKVRAMRWICSPKLNKSPPADTSPPHSPSPSKRAWYITPFKTPSKSQEMRRKKVMEEKAALERAFWNRK